MPFSLRICKPLDPDNPTTITPLAYIGLDPQVTSLEFTTVNPGGYGALNVGFQPFLTDSGGPDYIRMEQPIFLPPRAHVELYAGRSLCFAGAVMTVHKNASGMADAFVAEGYGTVAMNDQFIVSTDLTPQTSGNLLLAAIAEAAPLISISSTWVDPGVTHSMSEFSGLMPADIVNQIVREGGPAYAGVVSNAGGLSGDVSGGVWDFLVYENRAAIFQPRLPPAGTAADPIDYWVAFDDRVQWIEDYHKLVGQVALRYNNLDTGGATATISPRYPTISDALYAQFKAKYGFMRASIIEGGKMRAQSAAIFSQNFVASRSQPSYAVQFTRLQLQGMEWQGMAEKVPYLVRAGEWVQIGDQGPLPIVSTSYDAFSEVLTAKCGDSLPYGMEDNRSLHRVANHVIRNTNPLTGARTN